MEGAIKMIRDMAEIDPGKTEIISLETHSMDGRSARCRSPPAQISERLRAAAARSQIHPAGRYRRARRRRDDRTAGIVIEGYRAKANLPRHPEYGRKARELADRHNALLLFDEIHAVWAGQRILRLSAGESAVMPDILVAAKPLACGLPLGAIVANERAASGMDPACMFDLRGGALQCRVALEFFDILEELLPSIARVGVTSSPRCEIWLKSIPS